MAADLADTQVRANILLPGGATATGMIPDEMQAERRATLLDPAIMGPPIVWLASAESAGVHDERIVARKFDEWLAARESQSPMGGSPGFGLVNPSIASSTIGSSGDADLARRAWRAMSEVALNRDRKVAVSEALGLSWTRVLALRALATRSYTLRALAQRLSADPPYVTLMVDDLEKGGLVRRMPHPEDRRAKLVELTAAGRAAAARADAILDDPPAELRHVPAEDLAAVVRVLERLDGRGDERNRLHEKRLPPPKG
jgi:DNA-binding MarR family transcriptional regulator